MLAAPRQARSTRGWAAASADSTRLVPMGKQPRGATRLPASLSSPTCTMSFAWLAERVCVPASLHGKGHCYSGLLLTLPCKLLPACPYDKGATGQWLLQAHVSKKEGGSLCSGWFFYVVVVVLNWFQIKTPHLKLESAATTIRTRSG